MNITALLKICGKTKNSATDLCQNEIKDFIGMLA